MRTNHKLPLLILTVALVLSGICVYGAPPPPSTGGSPCFDPSCVPLDGGISYLLIAALGLGFNKLRKTFKQ